MSVLASLEEKSEHPIAHAIVNYAKEKIFLRRPLLILRVFRARGLKA